MLMIHLHLKHLVETNKVLFLLFHTPVERGSSSGTALRPSPKNGPPDRFINGSAVFKET